MIQVVTFSKRGSFGSAIYWEFATQILNSVDGTTSFSMHWVYSNKSINPLIFHGRHQTYFMSFEDMAE